MKTIYRKYNRIIADIANINASRRRTCQRGQALVPVIFVMLILTVIAVGFAVSAQREVRSSANFVAETQRFRAAQGALNYAMSALAQSSTNGATYGVIAPMPDTDATGWSQVGDAWVKIEAIDTGAYLNINNADLSTLQKIPVLRDNSDLASAILEWRTSPSSQAAPSATGSADYYQQQQPPYTIKGAAYDTVEELLLIKGMTPSILYGSPSGGAVSGDSIQGSSSISGSSPGTRQVGGKPPGTPSPTGLGGSGGQSGSGSTGGTGGQNSGGAQTAGGSSGTGAGTAAAAPEDFSDIYSASTISLAQMLTTAARERNVASDGSARVNINTATQQDLTTKLGLNARQARNLISYRTPVSSTGGGNTNGNGNGAGNNGGGQPGAGNGQPGGNLPGGGPNGAPSGQPGVPVPGGSTPRSARRFVSRQASPIPGGGPMGAGGMNGSTPGGNGGSGAPNGGGIGSPGTGGSSGTGSGGNNTGSTPAPIFKSIADLLDVPGFTRTVMQQVADRVAVDDSATRENVININTAPGEVLAAVPGMDHATLTAILQYRQGGQAFQTLSDLFSIQDIGRETFKKILPYLTAKSSVYYVRIKVRTSGQQGMYAAIGTIELKSDGAHVLQWREVQRKPGWADWRPFQKLPAPTPSASGTAGSSPAPAAGGTTGQ